jgi:hypothetical protein
MRIENFKKNLMKICLFFFCSLVSINQAYAANSDHAQLSSSLDQIPGTEPLLVVMENTESISGLTVNSSERVIVHDSGIYSITATARMGAKNSSMFGNGNLYIYRNNNIINFSSVSISPENLSSTSLTVHSVLRLNHGDSISLRITSDKSNIGLITSSQFMDPPVPSIHFSMFKVAN